MKLTDSKRKYWLVTKRFQRLNGKLSCYGYEIYTEYQGRAKKIIRTTGLAIPRSKVRKLVKVLNGDL